ncbi:MAG TPA: hypothetical protein VF815_04355 [Myxococcaceae bacterium]|jgi:hypothetical protein
MNRAVTSVCLAAVAVVGCIVSVSDFAGKTCEVAADCPEPYVCVAARPGAGRTCEVLRLPEVADGGGGGPVPTYCADIGPILLANCVSGCHGEDFSGSNRDDFRLDYYEPPAAGQVKGAKAMATRIRLRAFEFQDMPPPGTLPEPTAAERALLARWAEGGAPLCDSPSPDGGLPPDGGTDGGR